LADFQIRVQSRAGRRAAGRGMPPVVRVGAPPGSWRDLYHGFLEQPWSVFIGGLLAFYLLLNLAFAVLFALRPGSVQGAAPGSVLDAFFFSLETMSTVGYGEMYPATIYGHSIVALEILAGVLILPLMIGLIIAKFTLPTARVLFSRNLVVHQFDGMPRLMFRVANVRRNYLIEARMKLTLLRDEETVEGFRLRRMVELPLVRDTSPFFALSWTVMHTIDETSPFSGIGPEDCREQGFQLVALLTGIDGTTSSMVYARHDYTADDILYGHAFDDVVEVSESGVVKIDFRRFDATRSAAA
jgi:inward rectifier potassium channel